MKAESNTGKTPLHRAKLEDVAQILLEHGADANALDIRSRTLLSCVSDVGQVGAARVLLEHRVDANARDANNATPLHLASDGTYPREQRLDLARLLLQNRSDIHAQDDKDRNPFMRATARKFHEMMDLLLEHGAEDHRV